MKSVRQPRDNTEDFTRLHPEQTVESPQCLASLAWTAPPPAAAPEGHCRVSRAILQPLRKQTWLSQSHPPGEILRQDFH